MEAKMCVCMCARMGVHVGENVCVLLGEKASVGEGVLSATSTNSMTCVQMVVHVGENACVHVCVHVCEKGCASGRECERWRGRALVSDRVQQPR